MADDLSLKESVLVYLDVSGGLQRLTEDCKRFNDSQQTGAVFRLCVAVSPSDVIEVDPDLGDCILHEPLKATSLFQSVCFLAIKTLSLVEKIHYQSQVNVILKLTNLPPFPDYTLDLGSFPRCYGPTRPVYIEGLVVAMTRVTKYTQAARYLCENDGCSCSTGFHHIRVHAPGATESATVGNNFSCMICGSPLKEDVKFRLLGDKQLVELIHVKALEVLRPSQPSAHRYQSITLFLRDDLCNSMTVGRLYRVIGFPAAHGHPLQSVSWSVEANGVQPLLPEYPLQVSSGFQQVLKAAACSPWRFAAVAAQCFGLEVAPPGLYDTLKLALLLSLVQTKAHTEGISHNVALLVLTADTLIPDRLMSYGLSLACRGVRHHSSGELLASLSRDSHGTGTANIHAGSALLATGGICMLGDLSCYKKERLDTLQSALESNTVSVFIPGKKYVEDADQQLSFPLQCSFWALADTSQRSGRVECALLGTADIGPLPPQLVSAFGLVIQCRDSAGKHSLLTQTIHTLKQAVQPGKPLYSSCLEFSTQDYKELIAHAQSLEVEVSPEAEKIIHGYFMASRRVRTQSQDVKISTASTELLVSLAEAHCKLSLRRTVLEEDAVIAVLLCENSVTLKHGASALVIPPDPVFPCDLGEVDGLHRRDAALDELHQNILRFIYAYAPGADTFITEE
ncbi:minichromosome maintenance domain-containing protein 2 isoform X2 [Nelusetta ayraudi]|uniref:minichromosome maintenance domain-containing protein 2 isoform X2 n=1 Tax=Nelusetta ayraudi TaxID=303726 RepID=UPI003F717B92